MNVNYVDVIVFVVLVVEFFIGINTGLIGLVFDVLSIVLAFFAARWLTPAFSNFLNGSFHLVTTISNNVSQFININSPLKNLPATIDNLNKAIQNLNLPQFLDNFLKGSAANTSITVIDAISLRIAQFVVSAISFVAVFVLALIVLRIVGVILRKAVRINPFLKWVDVVFGGVVRIFLFFAVIAVVIHALVFLFGYIKVTNNSFINAVLASKTYAIGEQYFKFINNYLTTLIASFK